MDLANNDKVGKLGLKLRFDLSREASKARELKYEVTKLLDMTEESDCLTFKQLQYFADREQDCRTREESIMFKSVYVPYLVLGEGEDVSPIERKNIDINHQKYDVLLELDCDTRTWHAHQSIDPSVWQSKKVDPKTCESLDQTVE